MTTKEERRAEYAAKREAAEAKRKAFGHNPEPSTDDPKGWLERFGHDRCAYLVERETTDVGVRSAALYIMKDSRLTEVSGLIAFITGLEYVYTRPAFRFVMGNQMLERKLFETGLFDCVRWL